LRVAELEAAEIQRYSRHLVLQEVGVAGQLALKAAKVAIVGSGGLGSPLGMYLAAAGVGTIGMIDFDVVDLSNLQRQVLYATSDVGSRKVGAAAERLRALNPHLDIIEHDERLTSGNALQVLAPYDVVVDGTDNFPTRYLVNDVCVLLGKPYVYGSILRFEGQVSVFDARNGPCYRCLFREPPPPGLVPSCAEGGVLGVMPGIIGTMQALETIKLIIGRGETLTGRLALFDALSFKWRELKLKKNNDCAICGANPTITSLIDYDDFCGMKGNDMTEGTPGSVRELTAAELKQKIDAGTPLALVDVREEYEWDIVNLGKLGAKLIPLGEVAERAGEIDRTRDVVVYCRSGKRSESAIRHLQAQGFTNLYNLKGGINSWATDVDPSMGTY
jgi:sulfur-carrier protein adenylyltransferase/sulfurtransferase